MPPRFVSLFLLATSVVMSISITSMRFPDGAAEQVGCHNASAAQPVTVRAPANGRAVFSIEELLARSTGITGCNGLVSDSATISVEQAGQGSLSLPGVNPRQVAFIPRHGFSGMSGVWSLVVRDGSGEVIGAIRVSFEVRNSLPVAVDDEIVAPFEASRLDVDGALGVLANDTDDNGDQLVVYSWGVIRFPWGSVTIQRDGSYRIDVTDHALRRPAQVLYLVWDQQGSPTSVDFGVLSIDFEDEAAGD